MSSLKKRPAPAEEDSQRKRGKAHDSSVIPRNGAKKQEEEESKSAAGRFEYATGFGGEFESEALPGALPVGQFTPQKCPYGLYAEQLSGTSFTTPRVHNQRSWLYRMLPTCRHTPFKRIDRGLIRAEFSDAAGIDPNQYRWSPFPLPKDDVKVDFVQGLATVAGTGSPSTKTGLAVHVYTCNTSMGKKFMVNSDGDLLIVPQLGTLTIQTEFGFLEVPPKSIAVIQRGMKFSISITEPSRGYVCEVYGEHLRLPDLGPIGANGLANARDFEHPKAFYDGQGETTVEAARQAIKGEWEYISKFDGHLFRTTYDHSPFDVVAWTGNYVPYRYDLTRYLAVNSVTKDHMDPSIFTVLTSPTNTPGLAALDFVIFPERWMVQEDTFRPPYYHRNIMTEFMGNIAGKYDAKPDGFAPGAASLHSMMIGHGPDAATFKAASAEVQKPVKMQGNLAFMFETCYFLRLTDWARNTAPVQKGYHKCWADLQIHFDPTKKE